MEPGPDLRRGRRDLDGLDNVEIISDLSWIESARTWAVLIRLTHGGPESMLVPRKSNWFVQLSEEYPFGRLKLAPAKTGGIERTFHHQDYNDEGTEDRPWRTGELCLDYTEFTLGRNAHVEEPFGVSGANGRLRWHVLRALAWLQAAAAGELASVGDHYEVPGFPGAAASGTTVSYIEDDRSFAAWARVEQRCGILRLSPMAAEPSVLLVTAFCSTPDKILLPVEWGAGLRISSSSEIGLWIKLNDAPVLESWQAPRTWRELCEAIRHRGRGLDSLLIKLLRHLRDGREHVLLIGFPIPETVGGDPIRMHWQPIRLPVLCQDDQSTPGFRANREAARYHSDRRNILAKSLRINWLESENWEAAQLGSRGRLPEDLTSIHIAILGGGSLGSAVAELLRRAGVSRLTIIDGQGLEAGNLCRHTLTLCDLKGNKAHALEARLNDISPHGLVDHVAERFSPAVASRNLLNTCEMVIDCTAEDNVLRNLERYPWGKSRRFISLSMGFGARRLFGYAVDAITFPCDDFFSSINPWLQLERRERGDDQLPREGVGCWHPVFPARADDVWMMASSAIKFIESTLDKDLSRPGLAVFEQRFEGGEFAGMVRITSGNSSCD